MAEERVDIIVTDKVATTVSQKFRDIASEAIKADSAIDRLNASMSSIDGSALTRLSNASARLTNAQAREVTATSRLEVARSKMLTETNRAALAAQKLATEQARTEAATERATTASSRARVALLSEENASLRLAAAKRKEAAAQTVATGAATRSAKASVVAANGARLAGHQTQNLIYQVNDIAVGLASGQKPLTVLFQQGSQISTVFGPGTGLTGIMRGLGSAVFSIGKQFAPLIIAAAAGAALFSGLAYEIRQTTDVAVGMGDVMRASFQLVGEGIVGFLQPALTAVGATAKDVFDFVVSTVKVAVNVIVGRFVFLRDATLIIWKQLPGAIGDAVISSVNIVIETTESGINYVVSLMNDLVREANLIGRLVGVEIGTVSEVAIGRLTNQYAGAGSDIGSALANAANKAFTTDFAGDAFTALQARSIKLAKERIAAEEEEKELTTKQKLLQSIQAPLKDYLETQKYLNQLLNEGAISVGQYNEALASLKLTTELRDVESSLGGAFANENAIEEIQIAEQERLNIVQAALDARILSEEEAAERIVAINRQAAEDMQAAHTASQSVILMGASDTFSSLADAAKGFAGEQSTAFKVMFAASKAFAIADSIIKIQQGVASAMSLPFPLNIPAVAAVAAQGASIIANIQAVAGLGFKDGGYTGNMGANEVAGVVHGKEFVFDAAATQRIGTGNLERMRSGNTSEAPYRQEPQVQLGVTVNIQNYGTNKDFDVQQISKDEVVIIARDVAKQIVQDDVPNIVAGEIASPNSRTSKSLNTNTDVKRRRG